MMIILSISLFIAVRGKIQSSKQLAGASCKWHPRGEEGFKSSSFFSGKNSSNLRVKISRKDISMNNNDPIRNGKSIGSSKAQKEQVLNIESPAEAIRGYCLDCKSGSSEAVRLCGMASCTVWPYRFGRSPSEADLQVPVYDDNDNFVGYREYRTYPVEVDGAGESR